MGDDGERALTATDFRQLKVGEPCDRKARAALVRPGVVAHERLVAEDVLCQPLVC
ncbi:MAG: hypothetical protein ABI355_20015 [Solirubrobacteraceae bacterium]